jgi:hypothetical protein
MEHAVLSQFQRHPALRSEFCGLETILGMDESISFEDYLNGSFFRHSSNTMKILQIL